MTILTPERIASDVEHFDAALIAADYDRLARYVSADFMMVNPLAQRLTKTEWLAWLASDIRYHRIERGRLTFRGLGDCILVTSEVKALMAAAGLSVGLPSLHHTFRTEVWTDHDDCRELRHIHLTRVDQEVTVHAGDPDTELELRRLEQRRSDAMERCDRESLDELYADDFVLVHGDGSVDDKEGAITSAQQIRRRVVSPRELKVQVFGDVALLTGPMTLAVNQDGHEREIRIQLGQLVRRQDQVWRFIWSQVTMICD